MASRGADRPAAFSLKPRIAGKSLDLNTTGSPSKPQRKDVIGATAKPVSFSLKKINNTVPQNSLKLGASRLTFGTASANVFGGSTKATSAIVSYDIDSDEEEQPPKPASVTFSKGSLSQTITPLEDKKAEETEGKNASKDDIKGPLPELDSYQVAQSILYSAANENAAAHNVGKRTPAPPESQQDLQKEKIPKISTQADAVPPPDDTIPVTRVTNFPHKYARRNSQHDSFVNRRDRSRSRSTRGGRSRSPRREGAPNDRRDSKAAPASSRNRLPSSDRSFSNKRSRKHTNSLSSSDPSQHTAKSFSKEAPDKSVMDSNAARTNVKEESPPRKDIKKEISPLPKSRTGYGTRAEESPRRVRMNRNPSPAKFFTRMNKKTRSAGLQHQRKPSPAHRSSKPNRPRSPARSVLPESRWKEKFHGRQRPSSPSRLAQSDNATHAHRTAGNNMEKDVPEKLHSRTTIEMQKINEHYKPEGNPPSRAGSPKDGGKILPSREPSRRKNSSSSVVIAEGNTKPQPPTKPLHNVEFRKRRKVKDEVQPLGRPLPISRQNKGNRCPPPNQGLPKPERQVVRQLDGTVRLTLCDLMRKTEVKPSLVVSASPMFEEDFAQLWDSTVVKTEAQEPDIPTGIAMPVEEDVDSRESSIGVVVDEATNIEPMDMEIEESTGSPLKLAPVEPPPPEIGNHAKISFSFGGFGSKKKEDVVAPKREEGPSMWADHHSEQNLTNRKPKVEEQETLSKPKEVDSKLISDFEIFMREIGEPVSDQTEKSTHSYKKSSRDFSSLVSKSFEDSDPAKSQDKEVVKNEREESLERKKRIEADIRERKRQMEEERKRNFREKPGIVRALKKTRMSIQRDKPPFHPHAGHPRAKRSRSSRSPKRNPAKSMRRRRSRSSVRDRSRSGSINERRSRSRSRSRSRTSRLRSRDRKSAHTPPKVTERSGLRRRSRSLHRRSRSPLDRSRSPANKRQPSHSPRKQSLHHQHNVGDEKISRSRERSHSKSPVGAAVDKENEVVDYGCFVRGDYQLQQSAAYVSEVPMDLEEIPVPTEPRSSSVRPSSPSKKTTTKPSPLRASVSKNAIASENEMPFPTVPEPVNGLFPVPFSFASTGPLFCWPYLLPDSSIVLLPYLSLQKPEDKSKTEHFLVVPQEIKGDSSDGVPINLAAIPTYDPTRAVPPPPPGATTPMNQPNKQMIARLLKMREIEREKARRLAARRRLPPPVNLETPTPTPTSASLSSKSATPMVLQQIDIEQPMSNPDEEVEVKNEQTMEIA